jgi:hypothetical protein
MNSPNSQTGSLNVSSDATSIYEGGHLLQVKIDDLMGNEVALRQLVNTLNLAHKGNSRLNGEVEALKIDVAAFSVQPVVAAILSIVNISGAVLIGFGTNFLSTTNPPPASAWILGVGIVLTALSALLPPFLPLIVKKIRRQ